MEYIFGIAALWYSTYLLTWLGLFVLLIIALICEANDFTTLSVFLSVVSIYVLAKLINADITVLTVLLASIVYAIIGVVWSVWRYKNFVMHELPDTLNRSYSTYHSSEPAHDRLKPSKNISMISHWILAWPISLINHAVSDIFRLVKILVSDVLIGFYNRIFEFELDKINATKKQENTAVTKNE